MGYRMIFAVYLLGILAQLFFNLGFAIVFKVKLRKRDQALKHWCSFYQRPFRVYNALMYGFNFKTARGLYSQLFKGRKPYKYFSASFDELFETLVRPLFISSAVNFFFVAIPFVIMDIYSLIFIPWGYELMIISIDNLLLAVTIFILEVIEFRLYRK